MSKKNSFIKLDPPKDQEIHWKILPLPSEWQLPEKERTILHHLCHPRQLSSQKEKECWTARRCLRELLQNFFPSTSDQITLETLEIENYHTLKTFPQFLISLSHTSTSAVAAIAERKNFLGIGIDIEESGRVLSPHTHHHFINDQDSLQNWTPLQLWVLKEAAFKALYPLLTPNQLSINLAKWKKEGPLVLKDLWIQERHFGLKGQSFPIGEYSLEKVSLGDRDYELGQAWVYC